MAAGAADCMLLRTWIVEAAREWLGTPYRHQASVRGQGCDCLGLIRGVWRDAIGPEPEYVAPYDSSWMGAETEERLAAAMCRHFRERPARPIAPGTVLLFRGGVCAMQGFRAVPAA